MPVVLDNKATEGVSDPLKPSLSLLAKIGSIVVHVDESLAAGGHALDVEAIKSLLTDAEVRSWIESMGVYLPRKRSA